MYIDIQTPHGKDRVISNTIARATAFFERFPHLSQHQATIAFSGGKDSVSLAHVMRQLGKDVRLKAVDMGYSALWEGRIRKLADGLGLPLTVVKIRDLIELSNVEPGVREDLRQRSAFLATLVNSNAKYTTPCTNCYNCKIVGLTNTILSDGEIIYFGHHADDMISSFLKSCIMYYDRWQCGHRVFERENFASLARLVADDLIATQSKFEALFLTYLREGRGSTEEPAYQENTLHGTKYRIGRPLLLVPEDMLRAYASTLKLEVELSGCGHTLTSETHTPREVIQYDVIPVVRRNSVGATRLLHIELRYLLS